MDANLNTKNRKAINAPSYHLYTAMQFKNDNAEAIINMTPLRMLTILLFAAIMVLISQLFTAPLAESGAAYPELSMGQSVAAQPVAAQSVVPACVDSLPTIEWLGEGPGTYTLPEAYEVFVVKRGSDLLFHIDEGTTDDDGSRTVITKEERERVYACTGNCDFTKFKYESVEFGELAQNQRIEMVVIDDDGLEQGGDRRINYWWAGSDPDGYTLSINDQQMVETLTFDVPFSDSWYFMANDSIGVTIKCLDEIATPTATVIPTETATVTPTVTATATESATATTVLIETATATSTAAATATSTATATATSTATATATSTATATETATATATDIRVLPEQEKATATPVLVPTIDVTGTMAIHLMSLNATSRAVGVTLAWETVAEVGTSGFEVWRSQEGTRAKAVEITDSVIKSRGSSSYGASYVYVDVTVEPGTIYTYWLVEVLRDGTTHDAGFTTGWAATIWLDLPIIMQ